MGQCESSSYSLHDGLLSSSSLLPTVVTLASSDPSKDAAILVKLFAFFRFRIEQQQQQQQQQQQNGDEASSNNASNNNNKAKILVDGDGGFTIILLQSSVSLTATKTWVVPREVISKLLLSSQKIVQQERILENEVAIISLTTTRILLLSPRLASSPQGRSALAQHLIRQELLQQGQQQQQQQQPITLNAVYRDNNNPALENDNALENGTTTTITPLVASTRQSPPPSSPLPLFPTLQASLLQQRGEMDFKFPINAREPYSFETDLFVGKVLLLVKPEHPEDDPYWTQRLFSKKKRRFVLQIQGKFKRKPVGQLYLGAEITEPMKVGLLTRAVLGILIRLLESFFNDLRYSFGDNNNSRSSEEEYPRVVAPAHTALERLVVTPQGETPPPISCEPFDESPIEKKKRLSSKHWHWNDTDTYSMTFYSMYLSLVDWQLVNLPVSDINLQTLWNDSDMRIVLYEAAASSPTSPKQKKHVQKLIRYAFILQVQYLGQQAEKAAVQAQDRGKKIDGEDENYDKDPAIETGPPELNHGPELISATSSGFKSVAVGLVPEEEEEAEFVDSTQQSLTTIVPQPVDDDDDDDSLFFFDALDHHHHEDFIGQTTTTGFESIKRPPSSPRPVDKGTELLAKIDEAVPAWIDMLSTSSGKGTNYTRVYAIGSKTAKASGGTRFCSKHACTTFMEENGSSWRRISKTLDNHFSPRLSHAERMRRGLALLLQQATVALTANATSDEKQKQKSKMEAFLAQKCVLDKKFLRGRKEPVVHDKKRPPPLISGFCARAHSDRHWVEEWVKVSNNLMISCYNPEKLRKPHLRISLSSIDKVERVSPGGDCCPNLPEFSFLSIHQVYGRSVYLMFASASERDRWLEFLVNMIPPTGSSANPPTRGDASLGDSTMGSGTNRAASMLGFVDDPVEQFFHNSSMWDCRDRRILNCAKLYFRVVLHDDSEEDALTIVQRTLRLASEAVSYEDNNTVDVERRRRFLDSAASLKRARVDVLSDQEKVAFFLNLYHVMIMHAFLIVGPPGSWFKWFTYFNNIAYQVDDDIFSLAELEHGIIRSQMSRPANFFSRFVLPNSDYRYGINRSDYRINFALNCGSMSNPPTVPIYSAERLEEQLDMASRAYLNDVVVKVTKRSHGASEASISLPRVCQWFADDFGPHSVDLLVKVQPFLKKSEQEKLESCRVPGEQRFDMNNVTIRYKDYNFQCRPLTLEE